MGVGGWVEAVEGWRWRGWKGGGRMEVEASEGGGRVEVEAVEEERWSRTGGDEKEVEAGVQWWKYGGGGGGSGVE